ncbi:uncharacterized protein MYCFIDRAFT_176048 [Pseudocercospora fijiensis CIRAD86]|uniref:Uncharacterized protein n=1 Tax=Pseudocercospora fijiensis (strain CIRAD86) TaxID=383855 RepID=M3AD74_PSEFD|nr:uncharacterized protein MYCFIDRAFT_176048 [Pseudocercospora fijiensis CIRAD86]EME82501.1 hypothetical protein MYCFIDRAFT_176048 [Pseudocercospora fijiensis CIRAD86]
MHANDGLVISAKPEGFDTECSIQQAETLDVTDSAAVAASGIRHSPPQHPFS